jgi:hypothetical protein
MPMNMRTKERIMTRNFGHSTEMSVFTRSQPLLVFQNGDRLTLVERQRHRRLVKTGSRREFSMLGRDTIFSRHAVVYHRGLEGRERGAPQQTRRFGALAVVYKIAILVDPFRRLDEYKPKLPLIEGRIVVESLVV